MTEAHDPAALRPDTIDSFLDINGTLDAILGWFSLPRLNAASTAPARFENAGRVSSRCVDNPTIPAGPILLRYDCRKQGRTKAILWIIGNEC